MSIADNQVFAEFNGMIICSLELQPVANRLLEEALLVAPSNVSESDGSVIKGVSEANNAGTSDIVSFRYGIPVRCADGTPVSAGDFGFPVPLVRSGGLQETEVE